MSSSPSTTPAPPPPIPDPLLAAANVQRLLQFYRTLAPYTIGGPSSTSLETPSPGQQQQQPQQQQQQQLHSPRPPADQRFFRKFPPFPWFPRAPMMPPGPPLSHPFMTKGEEAPGHGLPVHRKRHHSSENSSQPIFSPRDRDSSSLQETSLEGQTISCFNVGGEDRLCLTQILQLVLHDIPLARIHQACEELQIFCSTCSPVQLAYLRSAAVLPPSAAQCGLITKSDAERLCSLLLQEPQASKRPPTPSQQQQDKGPTASPPAVSPPHGDPTSFKIKHLCFGDCIGILHPQSYSSPGAKCIECSECEAFLSPQKFVCHSHNKQENRTCHWGFDSANWTAYIQVWDEYSEEEQEKYKEELDSIKNRFSQHTKVKRKWIESDRGEELKRSRHEGSRPLDLSSPGYHDTSHNPLNNVFLNPMSIPLHPPEKVGFPLMDPRSLYLQWAAGAGGLRPPGPLPPPYLHHLAQFHNLKALAAKTFLEQQNLAKTLLQQHQSASSPATQTSSQYNAAGRPGGKPEECVPGAGDERGGAGGAVLVPATSQQLSEFVVSVCAVLENTGVDHAAKNKVMNVVSRLVDRLTKAEEEKDSATLQLKGMEEKVAKLERELESKAVDKTDDGVALYESSSDAGIESGNEVDDCLSEK